MFTMLFAMPHPSVGRLALLAVVGSLAGGALLVGREHTALEQRAGDGPVEVGVGYRRIPTLEALTKEADIVVVGRVTQQARTRLVSQPAERSRPFQPASVPDGRTRRGPERPPADQSAGETHGGLAGVPETDYTVQVSRVIKGAPALVGRLAVTQSGGQVELPTHPGGPKLKRTVQFENDTLMQVGDEYVLFLNRRSDGSHYVVGGPQGRFRVRDAKVHPIDAHAPVGQAHRDERLEEFARRIEAIKT